MDISIIIPSRNEPLAPLTKDICTLLYPSAEIIISVDSEGIGKGWALQQGLATSTGGTVIFIDGDMDINPSNIDKLLPEIKNHDGVIAVKSLKNIPMIRKITSIGYRWLIRLLFNLPYSDTQTGLKIFKRKSLPEWQEKGFTYDVEILYKMHRKGCSIKEVPINITSSKKKGIDVIWKMLGATICLKYRLLYQS